MIALALVLLALAITGCAIYIWAVRNQSVATLDWIDARFPRAVKLSQPEIGRYGDAPQQKIIVYRPIGKERPEVVVFIHGGSWASGDPADYTFVARRFAQAGFATALVGYRLGEQGRFPVMLQDSASAVRWLLDHAGELGVSTERLVLTGHSAGAYNALMLGLERQWLGREGIPEGTIKGVASLAGPADFYPFDTPASRAAFGQAVDPERTQPVNFARADAPPMLLLHGTEDGTVRPHNSRIMAQKLGALGADARLMMLDGLGHGDLVMRLARPFDRDPRVARALVAFVDDVNGSKASGDIKPVRR